MRLVVQYMSLQTQLEIRKNSQKITSGLSDLSGWLKTVEGDKGDSNLNARLDRASQLKEDGNSLVRSSNHFMAEQKYTEAIEILSTFTAENAKKLTSKILLNRALCYLKLNRDKEALNDCTESFKLNPSVKALYRKSCAEANLDMLNAALSDITCALKMVLENDLDAKAECEAQLQTIMTRRKAREEKSRADSRRRLCSQVPGWCAGSPRDPLINLKISGLPELERIGSAPSLQPVVSTGPRYIPRAERMSRRIKI